MAWMLTQRTATPNFFQLILSLKCRLHKTLNACEKRYLRGTCLYNYTTLSVTSSIICFIYNILTFLAVEKVNVYHNKTDLSAIIIMYNIYETCYLLSILIELSY